MKGTTMGNQKLIEALTWTALKDRYFIGTTKDPDGVIRPVNNLSAAIEDGELLSLFTECAATPIFNGDLYAVFVQFSKNLSSTKTNMTKTGVFSGLNEKRWTILREFTTTQMMKLSNRTKSKWQYTIEDIDGLGNDWNALDSVYQGMMSKKAKNPEAISDMHEYLTILEYVSKKRSIATKTQTVELSNSLLKKLTAGKATMLSATEIAEILKNLGK